MLILSVFGLSKPNGSLVWSKRTTCASVSLCATPPVLAVLLAVWRSPPKDLAAAYFGWLVFFFLIVGVSVGLAWSGVTMFHALTRDLDHILTAEGRRTYETWADRATSLWPQLFSAVAVATLSCAALGAAYAAPGTDTSLYISFASFLSVGIAGLAISSAPYWIVNGTVLAWRLSRPKQLRLSPYDPAETPALALLARCYRLAFYGTCIGVAICLFPVLDWADHIDPSPLQKSVKITLFILALVSALAVALLPQLFLSQLVARRRRAIIYRRHRELRSGKTPDALAKLEMVIASKPSTVSESATVGLLLGLATALLPYGLRVLGIEI